ncbi:hypothetical protein D8674_019143 [Pyrus ussuriensis x Pyrus communis]|uniref:Uncharacterized protein n=1 Tax=Pyrus ussuriensis x Pyrus communis TaxID=2448454 RepID=A0A5N5GBH4_9ROSA|nr:hypothetical protein D8674_019143 [Pyrus ussuriensis x Pyrus communis]
MFRKFSFVKDIKLFEASTFDVDYDVMASKIEAASVFPPIPHVIGRISALQQLEPKQINQRVVYKCDVVIQNFLSLFLQNVFEGRFVKNKKEELTVTLWADIAEAFSSSSTEEFFFANHCCFHKFESQDLPRFSDCKEALEILPPSAIQGNEAQIFQSAKKVIIDELAFLDPDLHKRFDTRFNWWYSACLNCVKQMQKDRTNGQFIFQKHPNQIPTPWYKVNLILEDETNELNALIIGKFGEKLFGMPCKDLFPNEFLRLIGHKFFFHLQFSNRRNGAAMQPATPQPLSREITMSSTTVSSPTSMVEPNEQSFKRKRESIRRALFTGSEQRFISDTDSREFDEVPIKLLKKKSSPTAGKPDDCFLEREQYSNRSWTSTAKK